MVPLTFAVGRCIIGVVVGVVHYYYIDVILAYYRMYYSTPPVYCYMRRKRRRKKERSAKKTYSIICWCCYCVLLTPDYLYCIVLQLFIGSSGSVVFWAAMALPDVVGRLFPVPCPPAAIHVVCAHRGVPLCGVAVCGRPATVPRPAMVVAVTSRRRRFSRSARAPLYCVLLLLSA